MTRWIMTLILLAGAASSWAAAPPAPEVRVRARQIEEAIRLSHRGTALYHAGKVPEAAQVFADALERFEALYPQARYPQGHADLATSLCNLAFLCKVQGKRARAETLYRRALRMYEGLYPPQRFPQGHTLLARTIADLALLHLEQREHAKAEPLLRRAVRMREALYPRDRYPKGHPDLAQSLNNLAGLHKDRGEYAQAEPLFRWALEMRQALFPPGHPYVVNSTNNLALLYKDMALRHKDRGEHAQAEMLYQRALRLFEGLYPPERFPQGHPFLAYTIDELALLYMSMGDHARAEPLFRRALRMREALYPEARFPQGHSDLAQSLNNLGRLYQDQGEYAKAELLSRRALRMYEALYPPARYPQGHSHLAISLNNLARLHEEQGEFARAEPLFRRALRMHEALYPQGHPHLAHSLNNLAALYKSQGEFARAEPLYRRALTMCEGLYPKSRYPQGHVDLAQGIGNLAALYLARREFVRARPLFERALAMREGLYPRSRYPQGHAGLALDINNLGWLLREQGQHAEAERLLRRALQMREGLYPKTRYPQGHPLLARSLTNLAVLYQDRGEHARAEELFRRALQMFASLAAALVESAPEATALNYLVSLPPARDAYLSVTRTAHRADTYQAVWQTKGALSRLYERRHLGVLAASSPGARSLKSAIHSLRRQREAILLTPPDPATTNARDKQLDTLDEEIRKKEAQLLPLLPALKRFDELARATPGDLRKALPAGVALVDLLRYTHYEQGVKGPGEKGEKRTACYVAFVVTRQAVVRVELDRAQPIEELLDLWRRAVQEGSPSEPDYAARLHALLWKPLRQHLPARTTLVYVSPDAALNRLPWAALRDGKSGRVLIEEHATAVVPHGVLLLDRLTAEKLHQPARPTLLAMGGVAYDRKPGGATELALRGPLGDALKWANLAGTHKEVEQIVTLAGDRRIVRREGAAAGVVTLLADLPTAQTAHLATPGFFADARFRTVLQLDEKLFHARFLDSGETAERIGAGACSPMVLSGLVCSGANVHSTPNRGVLTAEAIAGLDLRKMKLAVLSACETGLGDSAGGEGVYGLVRAFHLAGCRNVAATLWKVDDEATAALMVLFYRHLWGKQPVSAVEALRRAQLAVYREPGRIKEWSQGRGPLPVPVPGSGKPSQKAAAGKTSPARTWAAFVLSGPGD
jgi:CHAT domain-containing protein/Tfp pilus assembly protein PilF